ncbi:hypothetical protein [Streptomyces albipurpureus]|uniref:Lipoprotein n=1 Tax=Streptomyces albipurpureus TaxID=2897419 RepID=A0ABT0UH85_9ACTN|nr:hypothetical protein [Streptomyces sp. CWNU-1]MCM2387987.1 hypothetical protein [Streptomyces sp. CWNU-1]
MRPHPCHRTLYAAALTAVVGVLSAGCGNAGEMLSAGPTPTATGPVRLWPGLPPVTAPPYDYGETNTARIPGITVPGSGVRGLDPVAVVKAEAIEHPELYNGPAGFFGETIEEFDRCGSASDTCPVLMPYYRDLTGDGAEELILAIKLPEQLTAVRVYSPDKPSGALTRIMSTADQLVRVELAGRDIVLRSVSAGIPGYEYRTAWSWEARNGAMLPTRDEIIRVKPTASPTAPGASRPVPEPR